MRLLIGCSATALALLCTVPASAQEGPAALRLEYNLLFQRLLEDPSDLATNRRFIEVALELEDYEAAIGALERLLFYDPTSAALNYQIGELYFRIGSYVIAQSYFETALTLSAPTDPLYQQAQARIAAAERRAVPSPFTLYAQAGLRYQTNATAGPDDLEGVDEASLEQSDWNAFVLTAVNYAQDIGPAILEAAFTGYYADQFEIDRLDIGLVELIAGPRIPLGNAESTPVSVKPYGIVGGVLLADDPYLRTLGGGFSVRAALSERFTVEPYAEYRDRRYYDTEEYPTASELSGDLRTYAVFASANLGENALLISRSGLNQNDAEADVNSYDEYFVDLSLRFQFERFEGGRGRSVIFVPFGSVNWTDYEEADPNVDPDTVREDLEWRAGARLEVPVADHAGFGVQVQYSVNDSNLARYDYDNLQVTAGPTVRF